MKHEPQGVVYVRDPGTRNLPIPYEQKYSGLLKAITENAERQGISILIAEPWVIGDTYEEIIESLSRLAGTGLSLVVVTPGTLPDRN